MVYLSQLPRPGAPTAKPISLWDAIARCLTGRPDPDVTVCLVDGRYAAQLDWPSLPESDCGRRNQQVKIG
jgi:hypothetical protein